MAQYEFVNELRPCYVNKKKGICKALFHTWEHYSTVIDAGLMVGSHPAGQISVLYGIVEYEDGTIDRVDPSMIHFCDSKEKMSKYDFGEEEKANDTRKNT